MKEIIKEKAHNKAFAKIHALEIRVSKLKYDIERKNTGAITMHELEICLDAAKRELETWNYIFKLCLLYTSPSPRDRQKSRMPSSA